jgi:beta-glucosidase
VSTTRLDVCKFQLPFDQVALINYMQDMTTRVLAAWYKLGQDSYTPLNKNANTQGDHASLIRQVAAAGTVLLKNKNDVLPVKSPKSIAIIGSDAGPNPDGINSCSMQTCNKGVLTMGKYTPSPALWQSLKT